MAANVVGMTRFELATSRTLSGYSNRTEPHPESLKIIQDKFYPRLKAIIFSEEAFSSK